MLLFKILFVFILYISCQSVFSQLIVSPELAELLKGKTTFNEIMKTVTRFYVNKNYTQDRKLVS